MHLTSKILSGRKLVWTMALIVTIVLLYTLLQIVWSSFEGQKQRLLEQVIAQKEMIEAVARFDSKHSQYDYAGGSIAATLVQVTEAFSLLHDQGRSEFVLGEQRDDQLFFIYTAFGKDFAGRRHEQSRYELTAPEYSLPMAGPVALPMKKALAGDMGTVSGQDYRGVSVLAAYVPVDIGGQRFGLVTKINSETIWQPIVQAGLIAVVLAIVLIALGARRFLNLVRPMIQKLELELTANDALISTSPNGIITIEANGNIISFNRMAEKLFGYAPSEVLGQNVKMLMPIETASRHDGFLAHFLESGEKKITDAGREVEAQRKDGSRFPIHLAIGIMRVGSSTRFVGMISDISERIAAEKEIREHRNHLEELVGIATAEVTAIVQTAVNSIITINARGIIHIFNPSAEKLFGWNKEEVIGKNVSMLMASDIAAQHDGFLAAFLKTGKATIIGKGREITARRKDGSTFPAHLAVGHATLKNGGDFFVGFLSDITLQKRHERELRQAKEAAESAAQAKAAFLANMSHEIRTPMNAVIGFSEVVIKDPSLAPKTAQHVGTILSSAKALLGIINDILDVSKLESGKFELEATCFHLPNAVKEALRTVEHQVSEKGLTLKMLYDTKLSKRYVGDPTRLRQVILNLVGNAIKFTEQGNITISVQPGERTERLHFSIIDSGIGMTERQASKVFESFSQADESTTRRFGGTGLGTTISKQLVEMMGGEIWVESTPGEGSTFHFTVYMPVATESEGCLFEMGDNVAEEYISPRLFRVILAEDIEANATLAKLRLEEQGHTVFWAKNGREAVEESLAHTYDLILMDVMMPELDGLEATKKIRKREVSTGRHLPIVALTASVMQEDHRQCLESGMDGVEGKPINFDQLFATMEEAVPHGGGKPNTHHTIDIQSQDGLDFSPVARVVDYESAIKTWRAADIYAKALTAFATDRCNDAQKMSRLLKEHPEDGEPARRVAHALKGVAGNLAMDRVAVLAMQIDAEIKSGKLERANALLMELEQALQEVGAAIGQLRLPKVGDGEPTKTFDAEIVQGLIIELLAALEALNPDVVEPVLKKISEFVSVSDLASIQRNVDGFDFDAAKEEAKALANQLNLKL
ncbi:MAG: PAS domain S-box protein [Magnetococcales bacterium]|nr:PAS domain S-box protein [Magnetococcales bacterium]